MKKNQYHAALAITGETKGISQVRLYKEPGLGSWRFRRWFGRLCTSFTIKTRKLPKYLYQLIPSGHHSYNICNFDQIERFYCKNRHLQKFFPHTLLLTGTTLTQIYVMLNHTWYKFRNLLLKLGRPKPSLVYIINDPLCLKLLARMRLDLSHFNEQRFRHNFRDSVNLLSTCSLEVESMNHLFWYCHNNLLSGL